MKVLAVASSGGHWEELIRITKAFGNEIALCYVSTSADRSSSVGNETFYAVEDFSRSNCFKILQVFFQIAKILKKEKPDVVITTGAAPGLIAVFSAMLWRKKTIWVDSLANAECLSLSGRMASWFVSRTYTQWEGLKSEKVFYAGNILG